MIWPPQRHKTNTEQRSGLYLFEVKYLVHEFVGFDTVFLAIIVTRALRNVRGT
jgi:hypothetical protein